MRKYLFGLLTGFAIGALAIVLVRRADLGTFGETIDKQKESINLLEKEIQDLQDSRAELALQHGKKTFSLNEVTKTKESLENQLAASAEEVSALRNEIEQLKKQAAQPTPTESKETSGASTEEEQAELQKKMMERYSYILKVGEPLSEKAVEELGLDDDAAGRVNSLLKDEADRTTKALADFCRENLPNAPEDLSEWSAQALIGAIAPKVMKGLAKLGELSLEDRFKLAKGEKDLLDYLPRDSMAMKLGYALHQVRQETYRQMERELPSENMDAFKDKYLPPNDFVFEGNLNLMFGEIDWEKER